MATHLLRCSRNRFCCLGRIQSFISKINEGPLPYSTAAKHRSSGDDCHGDDGADEPTRSVTNIEQLELRASRLGEQVQSLNEKYKKALSDSDMVRRRTQKFVEDAKLFGIQSFCRDLVEVADLLELERLEAAFSKHGLEKMLLVGGRYDPHQHQIVCHIAAPGVEPGAVAVVKQEGYRLHGRTVRHARVGIAMATQAQ
ncbi:hypothetical protein COCON_G00040520 [Conger conger]|uniref:GrpE protein homolog n=1 Tax=Conger conger TaxID=82655 RepID=A0A9Q1I4N6_CONCO|nr:hypothetical protein COCON_G00040520 [Conger conger]